ASAINVIALVLGIEINVGPLYDEAERIEKQLQAPWRFRQWQTKDLLPAAELVFDSYHNSIDAGLCHDYQSRQGCVRFLRNLIDSPACGRFRPEDTLVAVDHFDQVSGVLLATRTQKTTEMIPQFSVRRRYQGRGLGTIMLNCFLAQCHLGEVR
ncbi:MAG: hypothetical protein P8Y94_12840, partial [Acidobacteriota bacterium]